MSDGSGGVARIVGLTSGDTVDCGALHEAARTLGDEAIDPLLDALAASASRAVRECILDCLAGLGGEARARAATRTSDPRWYVVRNMVALVARGPLPDGFDLLPFLSGGDPRVRVEAVAGIRWLEAPQGAWTAALSDPDPRVVTAALRAVDPVSPGLTEPLVRVARTAEVEEMRILAVRALGRCTDPAVTPALVGLTGASRGLFGGIRLKARTRVAAEAVAALATSFPDRAEVRPILAAAVRSGDPLLRGAASTPRGSDPR
jgi:HEAT repeat protein